jgi:signal transduction histidine kinase
VTRDLPTTPISATGDATLLRIIFNNLFDNAVSYTPPGGEIRIRGDIVDGRVEIRISNQTDDLPDNLDRLFEPLFRKESSRSDAGAHLGIGLTLSLEAATAMGATLQVRKTDDGGVEFVLGMETS